jgi:hypothetical protein
MTSVETSGASDNASNERETSVAAKKPTNHGKPWTKQDVATLKKLAKENTPTRVIGIKTGRTEDAVQSKASEEGISLKPTNQSPYGTKKD